MYEILEEIANLLHQLANEVDKLRSQVLKQQEEKNG